MIRTAVVGVGYLGRFHAQKYASLPNSHLVGVADPSAKARLGVAAELSVAAYADYRELLGHVDAVSIVTPTPLHFEVAKDFLDLFDVLVVDPLAPPITALHAFQNVLPHGPRRLQSARPFAAPLQLPAKSPDAREALGTEIAALAGGGTRA